MQNYKKNFAFSRLHSIRRPDNRTTTGPSLDEVGTPSIIEVGRLSNCVFTSFIPQLHPAYGIKSDHSRTYRWFEILCWTSVWVHWHSAKFLLKSDSEPDAVKQREKFCRRTLKFANASLEKAGLNAALANARAAMKANEAQRALAKKRQLDEDTLPLPEKAATETANLDESDEDLTKTRGSYPLKVVSVNEDEDYAHLQHLSEKSAFFTRLEMPGRVEDQPNSQERMFFIKNCWESHGNKIKERFNMTSKQFEGLIMAAPAESLISAHLDALKDTSEFSSSIQDRFNEVVSQKNLTLSTLDIDSKREIINTIAEDIVKENDDFLASRHGRKGYLEVNQIKGFNVGSKYGTPQILVKGHDGTFRSIKFRIGQGLLKSPSKFSRRMLDFVAGGVNVVDEHNFSQIVPVNELDRWAPGLKWSWTEVMSKEEEWRNGLFWIHDGRELVVISDGDDHPAAIEQSPSVEGVDETEELVKSR